MSQRLDLAAPGHLTPLTGRDTELRILLDRWEQSTEGLGHVVLLIGDAGLGKSRLVRELRESIQGQEAGARIIELHCSPVHRNTLFYPVVEFFERILGFERNDNSGRRLEHVRAS